MKQPGGPNMIAALAGRAAGGPPSHGQTFWCAETRVDQPLPQLGPEVPAIDEFRLLAENIPVLCWIANGDGYIVWYNRRWHEYCGTTPAEMAGWGWQSVHHPDVLPEVMERWQASIAEGAPFEMTFPLRGADGVFRPFLTRVQPVRDKNGRVARWFGSNVEISGQKHAEILRDTQNRLLELAVQDCSLEDALKALVREVEARSTSSVRGSVLLLDDDGEHLRHGAAPSLPDAYNRAIDGIAIGPGVGSCGTAAYAKTAVYVTDIATDPLWKDFRELALPHGLRACWSTPIISGAGTVLGTFAMYYDAPREPEPDDLELVDFITRSASLIIARKRSEQALRASEARFRDVFQNAGVGMIEIDADWNILASNSAYCRITGRGGEELLGANCLSFTHEDDLDKGSQALGSIAAGKMDQISFEKRYVRPDGSVVWVRSNLSRISGEEGSNRFLKVVEDITDIRAAREALRESEARFRAMADSAPAPVWVTGPDGIEFANRAFEEVAGVAADKLTGEFWMSMVHPDDRDLVLRLRAQAWEEKRSYGYEARFRNADGEFRWMQVACRTRFDAAGELIGYVGLAIDVDDAHRVEQALREESARLETLNRIGASLAPELDVKKVVQLVTDAGVALSGAQFGAFFYNVLNETGESYMLYAISGVDPAEFAKFPMPRNTTVFGPTFAGEGVVRSDDITKDPRYGRNAPYKGMPKGHLPVRSYLAVPVVSRSGAVIGGLFFGHAEPARFGDRHERLLVGVAGQAAIAMDNATLYEAAQREIAERTRAEEEVRELNQSLEARIANAIAEREQAEAALRQAQKMEAVGQLTGGIAHDFNNLLTIITGNLDAARRHVGEDGSPRVQRALGNALVGAERAAVLTQRLLAFSRRQPLNPRPVDPNRMVNSMSELLHRTLGETIEVETVLAAGLWRVEVDAHQLENAILNLAVNARDAMLSSGVQGGGKLTIETANTHIDRDYALQNAGASPGQYVVICVSDTGSGMDADTLGRAFEPFFTTKEVGKGTGLGLSMVYGFVKQSGGHLKIYSEEGQGTTVRIYLPRLLAEEAEEEERPEAPVPEGTRDETILVCEDDDDVRAYTVEMLRELGYRVLEAHDGPSAIRLLERQEGAVDLLFTDVVLPGGMTGAVVAQEARRLRPELRILFTTGYARNAIVHHGRLDPGVELLTKPFAYADLAARVRDMLDRR